MAKKKYWELPFDVPAWRESPTRYAMSLAERGLYFEMLAYQWLEGSCPTDITKLARVCAVSEDDIEALLPTVRPNFDRVEGNRFANARLEDTRSRKAAKGESSRENGMKGGRPKTKLKPSLKPNDNQSTNQLVVSSYVIPGSDSPEDFQATLETLKDEHPGSYHADDCGRALSNLTGKGYALEDILIAHRNAQKAWKTRIPPDLEKWLWAYSPGNKLVGFEKENKPKSALAAMEGL